MTFITKLRESSLVLSIVVCTGTKTFLDKHQVQCVGSSHKSIHWIPKHALYHKHDFTCIDQDFNLYLLYRCYMCTHTHTYVVRTGITTPSLEVHSVHHLLVLAKISLQYITVVVNPGMLEIPPNQTTLFLGGRRVKCITFYLRNRDLISWSIIS